MQTEYNTRDAPLFPTGVVFQEVRANYNFIYACGMDRKGGWKL